MYNMVRIIAGTLVEVGRGAFAPSEVKEMLEQKERGRAGATAPPQGLVLLGIVYDGQADTERYRHRQVGRAFFLLDFYKADC